ncbi:MAG: sulfatase/phosphatase domain-containing protein, partial [Bacteroidota bacterium]
IENFVNNPLTGQELSEWKYRRYMEDYLGSVAAVDEGVGRVLDYLDDHDLTDNTIVIYTSDQGFYLGEHGWYDKRWMYEESLSMPLLMRYPREIAPAQRNRDIVLNLDLAPTLLDYADVEIPDDFQGRSLRNVAGSKTPEDWRTSMYYEYFEYPHGWHSVRQHNGVRTSSHKLIHYQTIEEWELFDLENDPTEMTSVYDNPSYAEVQADLHEELDRLRQVYSVSE